MSFKSNLYLVNWKICCKKVSHGSQKYRVFDPVNHFNGYELQKDNNTLSLNRAIQFGNGNNSFDVYRIYP